MHLTHNSRDCHSLPSHLPGKSVRDLKFAFERGVTKTTADSISEIDKVATHTPDMQCIIRVFANDPQAQCQLSNKFGAPPEEWESLLQAVKDAKISLIGTSFHVGSGAQTPEAYRTAIKQAHVFIQLATNVFGFENAKIIDIGGGFSRFRDYTVPIANCVMETLRECFPVAQGYQWIAEPGRFMVEHSAHLVTQVIGRKLERAQTSYTLADGLYGSFNCILYDHTTPVPLAVKKGEEIDENDKTIPATLYGPTCDGFDTIAKDVQLPELQVGDNVMFPNMGAYTLAGASRFNGESRCLLLFLFRDRVICTCVCVCVNDCANTALCFPGIPFYQTKTFYM